MHVGHVLCKQFDHKWLPRRREVYNCILPFSPVYRVQGREVRQECECVSLYYTSTFKV